MTQRRLVTIKTGNGSHSYVKVNSDEHGFWLYVGDDESEQAVWLTHDSMKQLAVCGPSDLEALVGEFVRYWTTDRTPDGCGMCGGIPHSTTCYVGRMETLIATGNHAAPPSSGSVPSAAPQ